MSFKLTITQKTDPQLLSLFNHDIYADLTLITTHQYINLTLAYLSIDSDYFANLHQGVKSVDLSAIDQVYLIAVLRSLYGEQLKVSSILQLSQIFNVISFLEIKEYVLLIEKAIIKLHEQQGNISALYSIELLQFSMKNDIAKQLLIQLHLQNQLNALQTMRNYLQLSKLSKQHLNELLVQFLQKEGEKGYDVINRILQNYFNRKAYRASQYFQDNNLTSLKVVWQYFHHRFSFSSQNIVLNNTYPQTLSRTIEKRTSFKLKLMKLNSLPNINQQPLQYDPKLLKSDKIDEQKLLDIKIETLQKQRLQKDKKISELRKQILELRAQNQVKYQNQQDNYFQDLSLLQHVARSRKLRQKQLQKQQRINRCEQGFHIQKLSIEKKVESNVQLK